MAFQHPQAPARCHLPHPHGIVVARRRAPATPSRAPALRSRLSRGVAFQHPQAPARCHLPHPQRYCQRLAGERLQLRLGLQAHAQGRSRGVAFQHPQAPARCHLPHPHGIVSARRRAPALRLGLQLHAQDAARSGLPAPAGTGPLPPPTPARYCQRRRRALCTPAGSSSTLKTLCGVAFQHPQAPARCPPPTPARSCHRLAGELLCYSVPGSSPRSRRCRSGLPAPAGTRPLPPPTPARYCQRSPESACTPVAEPGHAQDAGGVAFQHPQAPARCHLPHPHGIVSARRRAPALPSRVQLHAQDAGRSGLPAPAAPARCHLPHPHGLVIAAGERLHSDRAPGPRSRRWRSGLPGTRRHRPVATSHTRTVLSSPPESACTPSGLQPHAQDAGGAAFQHPQAPARCHLPHPHGLVIAAGERLHSVRAPAHAPDGWRSGLPAPAGTGPLPPPTPARSCHRRRRAPALRPGSSPTLKTLAEWPSSTRRHRPVATSHTRTVCHRRRRAPALRPGFNSPSVRDPCGPVREFLP